MLKLTIYKTSPFHVSFNPRDCVTCWIINTHMSANASWHLSGVSKKLTVYPCCFVWVIKNSAH